MKTFQSYSKSLIALVQFVFLIQIALGWFILPIMMTSSDSAVFSQIREDKVHLTVVKYHKSKVRTASNAFVASGALGFVLITMISVKLRK